MFRKSPIKNEVLQKYVELEHGKEITFTRDCKTRSSSMLAMIDRFLFLRKAVSKALVDLSIEANLTEDDFVLFELVEFALEPLKLGFEAMYRQYSALLSADTIFRFIFAQLETC